MKVLFAVSNENISEAIIKKYQENFKEVISYKNVYYFNAIIKEIQKDNTYDRIVISEDLEVFSSNNAVAADKFLFTKMEKITEEAIKKDGSRLPIIYISNEKRKKGDSFLARCFSIGIYNALIGNDRTITKICNLIKTPNNKEDAKVYYGIKHEEINNENADTKIVSDNEIKNINRYYKGIEKEKYSDTFNKIVGQYTEEQLKYIITQLPEEVKNVLIKENLKYNELLNLSVEGTKISVENTVKSESTFKSINQNIVQNVNNAPINNVVNETKIAENQNNEQKETEKKEEINIATDNFISDTGELILDFGNQEQNLNISENANEVKTFQNEKNQNNMEVAHNEEDNSLVSEEIINMYKNFQKEEQTKNNEIKQVQKEIIENTIPLKPQTNVETKIAKNSNEFKVPNLTQFINLDKKIVSFIGTSKNGVSFLVNSIGMLLSSIGIKTAILDMTKNRNSYYMCTNNDDNLKNIAQLSTDKLKKGLCEGVEVKNNLTIFTALPENGRDYDDAESILKALIQNYQVVLIDTDFNTNFSYFAGSNEIYAVQSMDILTIQPLTTFLKDLKAFNITNNDNLRIVINKELPLKGITRKMIVGGISTYNHPSMSYMKEIFDKNLVKVYSIPFDEIVYQRYLENIAFCKYEISGYSKRFIESLKLLANSVHNLNDTTYINKPNNLNMQNTIHSNTEGNYNFNRNNVNTFMSNINYTQNNNVNNQGNTQNFNMNNAQNNANNYNNDANQNINMGSMNFGMNQNLNMSSQNYNYTPNYNSYNNMNNNRNNMDVNNMRNQPNSPYYNQINYNNMQMRNNSFNNMNRTNKINLADSFNKMKEKFKPKEQMNFYEQNLIQNRNMNNNHNMNNMQMYYQNMKMNQRNIDENNYNNKGLF